MTNNLFDEQKFLEEIFSQLPEETPIRLPEFRVYYDSKTLAIECFSQEILDKPYCLIKEEWYMTFRPDLFYIEDGEVRRRDMDFTNQNRLKPGTKFATIQGDMQFAVDANYAGSKDYWDRNG